jgi:ABC-type molybdate transport system substrate-binding protein
MAETAQQAWRYADSGNADVALTALSIVPPGRGRTLVIDQGLYSPIREALGVVRAAPRLQAAQAFAAFVLSPVNESMLLRHGFGIPEREAAAPR